MVFLVGRRAVDGDQIASTAEFSRQLEGAIEPAKSELLESFR